MNALSSYFTDFLAKVRLQPADVTDLIDGHPTLRARLLADETLGPIIVSTFLQGSYRRATAVRPENDKRSDVDVVIVTKLDKDEHGNPQKVFEIFEPFMKEHYKDKYEIQGRSIGIELTKVSLDCVITAAPTVSEQGLFKSEAIMATGTIAEEFNDLRAFFSEMRQQPAWKLEPLWIPDRDAECWTRTHPLEQIRWTQQKNEACNGHYVNVVKAIKWWRRLRHDTPKYPKGYPVEHLIGHCCPDGITSVAEGVTRTLENITSEFNLHALLKIPVELADHGVPEHNVFKRITVEDFAAFHGQVQTAADTARRAYNEDDVQVSVPLWQELFGGDFPDPPPTTSEGGEGGGGAKFGGFTLREKLGTIGGGRFA